jgi:hypothetical protein
MTRPLILISVLSACALASDPSESVNQAATGTASVSLSSSNAALTQTSNTSWALSKTGSVDTSSKTVTWTITATKGSTVAGQLVVSGFIAVTNTGGAGATIGNIVVNLQTKSGNTWTSKSVDVADATNDDAATVAHIDAHASSENRSSFTENSASGTLQFMDANSNTVFSLVPEKTIAPNATVNLLFVASFDNTKLKLATGTAVRAEVLVSFGNSVSHSPSAQNTDINGNGVVDSDESWVRTIPARLGLTVPAQHADNGTLTITDSAANIKTTGTVTFSGATFNIGATSGTASVHYDGGTSGGKITNCADGTGAGTTVTIGGFSFPIDGSVGVDACDTEDIGASTCTPGSPGCGWNDGDMLTYTDTQWGNGGSAQSTLLNYYGSVYAGTGFVFLIGLSAGYYAEWTDPTILATYLPGTGAAAALSANLVDPTSTSSGVFGSAIATLKLNIDFNDAGIVKGNASAKLGDLTLCGFASLPGLNGTTVRQFLATANTALGGGTTTYAISDLNVVAAELDTAFYGGSASAFAQAQLVNGSCP